MQGQAEWCQRNKDQNTLHTEGSCGAATLLFITSSVSAYVYLCTYNVCQFLRLAPTPAFRFSGDLPFFFSSKVNQEFGCVMHFCRRTHESRSICDGGSEARPLQTSKRTKEHLYVLSWVWRVVPFLGRVEEFKFQSPELWELDYTEARSPQLTLVQRVFAALFDT